MRCDDSNDQAVFGDLYLINEHPFGKWKQWGLFHHDLGSRDKQRGLQASSGRDYITKAQPAVGSKRPVCTKSRHESYLGAFLPGLMPTIGLRATRSRFCLQPFCLIMCRDIFSPTFVKERLKAGIHSATIKWRFHRREQAGKPA